jgi:hypothetical protein
MPRRLLNIASIVCLVLCVALMGMWVRSYRSLDTLSVAYAHSRCLRIGSFQGRITGQFRQFDEHDWWNLWHSQLESRLEYQDDNGQKTDARWVHIMRYSTFNELDIPYWLLVLISGLSAILLHLGQPWRFTLRHLFIMTTFLAVLLGMIAWLDRAWIGK